MPSIELRPARPKDVPEICALMNRVERHDNVPRVMTLEELEEELARPFISLAEDARVVEQEGELAGWAWIWHPPTEGRLDKAYVGGEVDPDHRGRGIGRALLAWSMGRARERLLSRTHDLPRSIRVDAYDWMGTNQRLYARFGFTPVRWFEELIRPLVDLPTRSVPEGLVLAPWPDDRDEDTRRAKNEAFADHWDTTPCDAEAWRSSARGHGSRRDLSVVAIDAATNEIVGLCLNHAYPEDNEVTGRRDAWITTVGTLRPWRDRGLASAMIARSLAAFEAAGFTHAMLGVDADSPTGAGRLYRSLGFEPLLRSTTFSLPVS